MAYDKIIAIRSRLDHCVSYALNPEKTDLAAALRYIENEEKINGEHRVFATALNCSLETAFREMQETKQRWGKPGGVLGYHVIHSYAPGEVTPEQAHEIGVEFAAALLGGSYEAVVSTHLDRDHLHCHIVFNSVSLLDGRKYRSNKKAYYEELRGLSNEISRKHGLSVIETSGSGEAYAEWQALAQGKPTIRGMIRKDIDDALAQAFTLHSLLSILQKQGYTIKIGPKLRHTAIRPPGGTRFIRLDSLGESYTEAEIIQRLKAVRGGTPPKQTPAEKAPTVFLPRGKCRYVRKPTHPFRRKPGSLRGLYFYYLHLLGKDRPMRRPPSFALRKEIIRLDRYQKQFQLLREYHIDSAAQLDVLHSALQAEIDALTERRGLLYREKRRGEDASEQIAALTSALRVWRKKLRLCEQIADTLPQLSLSAKQTDDTAKQNMPCPDHPKSFAR